MCFPEVAVRKHSGSAGTWEEWERGVHLLVLWTQQGCISFWHTAIIAHLLIHSTFSPLDGGCKAVHPHHRAKVHLKMGIPLTISPTKTQVISIHVVQWIIVVYFTAF